MNIMITAHTALGKMLVPRVEEFRTMSGSTQPDRPVQHHLVKSLSASTQSIKPLSISQVQKFSGASTELHELSDSLYLEIETIFWNAKGIFFEDGIENIFSRQLNACVKRYCNDALEAITCLIVYERVDSEVASEALRCLGRIEHEKSFSYRIWLLERSLSSSSVRVRDGALLGLASMDDRHAIPYLKKAIEKEQCLELKVDMKSVLEQLES